MVDRNDPVALEAPSEIEQLKAQLDEMRDLVGALGARIDGLETALGAVAILSLARRRSAALHGEINIAVNAASQRLAAPGLEPEALILAALKLA